MAKSGKSTTMFQKCLGNGARFLPSVFTRYESCRGGIFGAEIFVEVQIPGTSVG